MISEKFGLHAGSGYTKKYVQTDYTFQIIAYLPGLLDMADQVKYNVYKLTIEDCNKPERGWCSWTFGKMATTLTKMHRIKLMEMKNLFKAHPSLCDINRLVLEILDFIKLSKPTVV